MRLGDNARANGSVGGGSNGSGSVTDGALDSRELRDTLGPRIGATPEMVTAMIHEIDKDRSGSIDSAEARPTPSPPPSHRVSPRPNEDDTRSTLPPRSCVWRSERSAASQFCPVRD